MHAALWEDVPKSFGGRMIRTRKSEKDWTGKSSALRQSFNVEQIPRGQEGLKQWRARNYEVLTGDLQHAIVVDEEIRSFNIAM